jgi:putative transposase
MLATLLVAFRSLGLMTRRPCGCCAIATRSTARRSDSESLAWGIGEVLSAPSSPWQNPYAERLIGSIRRDCLNHVLVLGEQHLRRVLAGYVAYYHGSRTHLSLAKDAPTPRRVQGVTEGEVIAFREVGGLHHRYERRAA